MTRQLPAVIATAAETAHFLQRKEQKLSDQQRLNVLFDGAAECSCNVVLYESDEPEAATQLVMWASARRMPFERNSGDGWRTIEVVTTPLKRRTITVYLHAEVGQ